jgi:hypothetical protein
MLHSIDFDSWSQLEAFARGIGGIAEGNPRRPAPLLYRGQADCAWGLHSTLERSYSKIRSMHQYFDVAIEAKKALESLLTERWPEADLANANIASYGYIEYTAQGVPASNFLAHLRHHGFPSPLLDWSRSLYIAAYFAYSKPASDRVAIWIYQSHDGRGRGQGTGSPMIAELPNNVRAHRRHYFQQCQYTICSHFLHPNGNWAFVPYEEVFQNAPEHQDRFWKLTAPSSESSAVMEQIQEYNITAYSLFLSEDALMETVARGAFSNSIYYR